MPTLIRTLFYVYLCFVIFCGAVTLADPPWTTHGGSFGGFFGSLASMGAGLPWNILLIKLFPNYFLTHQADDLILLVWVFAAFNLLVLGCSASVAAKRASNRLSADESETPEGYLAAQSRPLGIKLVVVYSALSALMIVPSGCTIILLGQVRGGGFYLFCLLGLVSCAVVYGLWTLKNWGRSLAYWFYVGSIPLAVIAIFQPFSGPRATVENTIFQLVSIAIDLFIVAYLSKQQVKELYFGPPEDEPPVSEDLRETL